MKAGVEEVAHIAHDGRRALPPLMEPLESDAVELKDSAGYEGRPEDIGAARRFAADFLARARTERNIPVPGRVSGAVQLIVSELVTNACKFTSGPCLMDLELAGGTIAVTLWDSEPVLPVARAAEPGRVGQHGLEIVLALCERYEIRREPVGKRVRVTVGLDGGAAGLG